MIKATDIKKYLGRRVSEARQAAGMNKSVFAKKIQVSLPPALHYIGS